MNRTTALGTLGTGLVVALLSLAGPASALAGPAACDGPVAGAIHSGETVVGAAPVAGSAGAAAIHRAENAAC